MATNHTENYALNLWEPGDSFLRTEFNENFQKLDAAVLQCTSVCGTYLAERKEITVNLGFRPKLVMILGQRYVAFALDGYTILDYYHAAAERTATSNIDGVSFTDSGFTIAAGTPSLSDVKEPHTAHYIAFH